MRLDKMNESSCTFGEGFKSSNLLKIHTPTYTTDFFGNHIRIQDIGADKNCPKEIKSIVKVKQGECDQAYIKKV